MQHQLRSRLTKIKISFEAPIPQKPRAEQKTASKARKLAK
jgi:hypothetical protein